MKAVLAKEGQITIPKPLRDRLGLRPGQVLEFHEERGRLVGMKRADADPVQKVYGILKTAQRTDEILGKLRGRTDAR